MFVPRMPVGWGLAVADIFISYTSSDREWAFWIARELESLGHTPHIHEWEIKGGDDIYAWMESRHDAADHVLCVVSDDYLKAPYSTLERNAALWQAAARRPGFVLLVAVEPCRLPTLADHIRRCELYGVPEDVARRRLGEFMQKREAPAAAAFPGKVFAVSNIPVRVPMHFLGRDDSLAAIESALNRYEGRVAITALHGLRGVGKTTLAAAYAERHRNDYRATWWVRAQTAPEMRADLVALGVRLGWVAADEKEEPGFAAVMERLRHEGDGVLLIYDNAIDADALKPYLPPGGETRVLVTSNAHTWRGLAAPVEIRLWPKEIGADYLIARTSREDERSAAAELSEALGGLPLAHEQAAAYCERLEVSLAEYRQRFVASPARFLDDGRDVPSDYHDGLTVARTFALAIEQAARLHLAAEPMIRLVSFLAAEPIPLFFLAERRRQLGEPLASILADDGLDEAVAALRAFALVDRETIPDERDAAVTTQCIRLHRLVRQVAMARASAEEGAASRDVLIKAMAAIYPSRVGMKPDQWPRVRRLNPHILALVGPDVAPPAGSEPLAADLLDAVGEYEDSVPAARDHARRLHQRGLELRESVLGPDHPATAESLNNLAILLKHQGDYAEARRLYERAVATYERRFGPNHPDTATALGNLALLLQTEGAFGEARPLFERALAISEKASGRDSLQTATALGNLARLLQVSGEDARALQLNERTLAIFKAKLGADHPATASAMAALGNAMRAENGRSDGRALQEQALAVHEAALGPDHPRVAVTLAELAQTLRLQGDNAAARTVLERALSIREKALGPSHPDTAMSLGALGSVLYDLGEAKKAEDLLRRAIAIDESRFGAEHLFTQRMKANLARLLLKSRRAEEATSLAEGALAAHVAVLGPAHRWTKEVAELAARAHEAAGRAGEAQSLRRRFAV